MWLGSVSECFRSTRSHILIRVTACALIANNDEQACLVARAFMKDFQFITDGYRLFAAINRVLEGPATYYNSGPSQKYILRQVKAVDFSLVGEGNKQTLYQERASYSTRNSNGNVIHAKDLDVALLMIYGHILYAGTSYSYALSKLKPFDILRR